MAKILTFDDLNLFVDYWTLEMRNYQDVFVNQTLQLNEELDRTMENHEKVFSIGYMLSILYRMNRQVDENLFEATNMMDAFEKFVNQLENTSRIMEGKNLIDQTRQNIYGKAESINSYLHSCQEDVDGLKNQEAQYKSDNKNSPVHQIASIMGILLSNLKFIETKIEEMKSTLNLTHFECTRYMK